MRPVEMKQSCKAPICLSFSSFFASVRGKDDSERKSRVRKSKLWTLSSPRPMPLITALFPRRLTLTRYWSADCEWA